MIVGRWSCPKTRLSNNCIDLIVLIAIVDVFEMSLTTRQNVQYSIRRWNIGLNIDTRQLIISNNWNMINITNSSQFRMRKYHSKLLEDNWLQKNTLRRIEFAGKLIVRVGCIGLLQKRAMQALEWVAYMC